MLSWRLSFSVLPFWSCWYEQSSFPSEALVQASTGFHCTCDVAEVIAVMPELRICGSLSCFPRAGVSDISKCIGRWKQKVFSVQNIARKARWISPTGLYRLGNGYIQHAGSWLWHAICLSSFERFPAVKNSIKIGACSGSLLPGVPGRKIICLVWVSTGNSNVWSFLNCLSSFT